MRSVRKKRSFCASGRLNVPSNSTGFSVAIMKNGCGSGVVFALDADLPLRHRLQQRGLRTRRGAVDLIHQQDVGHDRAFLEVEVSGLGVVDGDAQHVGRQQVGRALNAPELASQRQRQRPRQDGLAHAGHVLQQRVAAAQQGDQQPADHLLLARITLPTFVDDRLRPTAHVHNGRV